MQIHAFISLSHEPLIQSWLESSVVDPCIEPVVHRIPIDSDGNYSNGQWKAILKSCFELTAQVLEQNEGNIIGITGADVIFLKPFCHEIAVLMENHYILMQRERPDDSLFNPDASFWKCSPALS